MKICFVCSEYPPGPHGGIGTMTQVLGRALAEAGHQVRVVGTYPRERVGLGREEDRGVQVWRLPRPTGRFINVRSRLMVFQTIKSWVREGEIDVVEVPDWEGWAAGWPRLDIPVVARLNGSAAYFAAELGQTVNRRRFLTERASLRRADFWSSVSQYTGEKTQRIFDMPTGPHAILYNPVEVPNGSFPTERSKNQVVFTGTLNAKKGVISLIKAWSRVAEAQKDAELHIYGKDAPTDDGQRSMKAFLQTQMSDGVRPSVHFHGHVSRERLFEILHTARLAVFPSYVEAFALAPLEAMACGCPTVYSRRSSGPELIDDGQQGLLIDPDQPDQLADAILRVLRDDPLAARLGEAGRAHVHGTFAVKKLVPRNETFFADAISSFRRNRG